jgi:hypothetical protein
MSKNTGQSPARKHRRGNHLKLTTNQGNKLNKNGKKRKLRWLSSL